MKINKSKAIEKLKELIGEIPHLRTLKYDNREFKSWRDRVKNIISLALDDDDYQKLVNVDLWSDMYIMGDEVHRDNYQHNLTSCKTVLQSIIDKYEMMNTEEAPAINNGKDKVKTPIQLFDAMQFHPRVIEASKSLFKTGNYASAILEAFKAVNILVKAKSGLSPNELRGIKDKQLMAKVFDEKAPLIKLNELISDTDISEQEGFKLLFMGATEGIRNPKAHDLIQMKDPYRTLEFLGFASLLMYKISFWKVD